MLQRVGLDPPLFLGCILTSLRASSLQVEDFVLGWGGDIAEPRLEGRLHVADSPAETWPFACLIVQHAADGRWFWFIAFP